MSHASMPIGISDFKTIRAGGYALVDKSLVVVWWLDCVTNILLSLIENLALAFSGKRCAYAVSHDKRIN